MQEETAWKENHPKGSNLPQIKKGFVLLFFQRYKLNFYSASTARLFSVYNTGTCNAM